MHHRIIDNFLSDDLFDYLCSLKLNKVEYDQILNHHNKISKDGSTETSCISVEKLKKLNLECHEKTINLLKELSPEKAKLYDYSDFNIIETGKNYSFPIHRDHVNKLLSGVIYLYPEKNLGTILYDNKNGENPVEIDWRQNRGFFFSRNESSTWHSYKGNGKQNRIVLVYNLMTNNTKLACEIEGLNYNFVKIREAVNPYLYRFFKKYI